MESFIVSARKYRPTTFEDVVGQEHVTKTLQNEIKGNKLAQAFLFCGPRGVGKTTCARILAKEINKDSIDDPEYDHSFSIFELDAASNNSVEDIRELSAQVRIPPQIGKYKVYIIDEVHMLSVQAFNAFLKTLEEPPAYAIFILATTEKHKILPTVLSRCQVFNFNRIATVDMVAHLRKIAEMENIKVEDNALHVIAQKSDGALRDALSMFDQLVSFTQDGILTYDITIEQLNVLDYIYFFKLTDAFINVDVTTSLLIYDKILKEGFDGQLFLNGLAGHFRDLMVAREPKSVGLLEVPDNIKKKYQQTAAELSDSWLVNAINVANKFDFSYKMSSNPRLHVELALIKMCHIKSLVDLSEKKKRSRLSSVFDKKSDELQTTTIAEEQQALVGIEPENTEPAVENRSSESDIQEVKERPDPVTPSGKATKRKQRKGLLSVNIDEIMNSGTSKPDEDVKEESTPAEEEISERVKEFTFNEVLEAYNKFGENLLEEGRKSLNAVFKMIVPVLEENSLKLNATKTQINQLNEVRVEFQRYMRDHLHNDGFNIEMVEIQEEKTNRKPYTDREKFEDMVKDNPSLENLRKKFGLEFD